MYQIILLVFLISRVGANPPVFDNEGSKIVHIRSIQSSKATHPYLAALVTGKRFTTTMCTGSIVTAKSVLTAAHCIDAAYNGGSISSTVRVKVGSSGLKEDGTLYSISGNITHPDYSLTLKKNNIGVLITSMDIFFTDLVQPIQLDYGFQNGGVPVRVAGWKAVNGENNPETITELTLETISGEKCVAEMRAKESVFMNHVDPDVEICTSSSLVDGTCLLDFGDPLVKLANGKLIGILSWGLSCEQGVPDVFARISAFKDWLKEVLV